MRGFPRLIASIQTERALLTEASGRRRSGGSLQAFNTFVDHLLQQNPLDWPKSISMARLSSVEWASQTKVYALYFLDTQTNEQGLGKSEHGSRYLALISACLLGYDLDRLWLGTALQKFRPAEAALWRALSRDV
jgi:hypothetical protein